MQNPPFTVLVGNTRKCNRPAVGQLTLAISCSDPVSIRPALFDRSRRRSLAALAAFLLLAIAWTWPLAARLSRVSSDLGDPILNTWILWWNTQAVPFTARWWSPPIFYPMPGALALSEHLFGIALVTTPMQWAGLSPVAAYNVAFILSYGLSGFFAFLLARRLTGSTLAAICGGLAFGFAPYRASQLSHLQMLTSQWMPLALLAMHTYLDDGRRRWLALFAGAWLVQALSNGYALLFFPVLLTLWFAWFVDWRRAARRGLALIGTWAASSLLLVPELLHYVRVQRAQGLSRSPSEMLQFSATLRSFLHSSELLRFWPSGPGETQEDFLFPGITAVVLVAAALIAAWLRRRDTRATKSPLAFYTAATAIMYLFAFGPAAAGSGTALLHPYTLLTLLPGFGGLRVPARFALLAVLCLAVAASLAFRRLEPSRPGSRWLFALLVFAGLSADGWMRAMPLAPAPGRALFPEVRGAAVIELPPDDVRVNTASMYRQMTHGRPLVNGYSGYIPQHYEILSNALRRGDPSVLTELARGRPLIVTVHEDADPVADYRHLVGALPGVERRDVTSAGIVYVLPAGARTRVPPTGERLPLTVTDGPREHAVLDLGSPRTVRTLGFALRGRYKELGSRFAIEASRDGVTWSTVWEDWTGGPALAASLEDPIETPVRITLPDVRTRYLRVHPAPPWLSREIVAYAPR